MPGKLKSTLLLLACAAVIMPLEGCMYSRQERQSDNEHYRNEPHISDRVDLDRHVR